MKQKDEEGEEGSSQDAKHGVGGVPQARRRSQKEAAWKGSWRPLPSCESGGVGGHAETCSRQSAIEAALVCLGGCSRKVQDQGSGGFCLVRAHSQLIVFWLSPLMVGGVKELFWGLFYGALTPFMRAPLITSKDPTPKHHHIGDQANIQILGAQKHSFYSRSLGLHENDLFRIKILVVISKSVVVKTKRLLKSIKESVQLGKSIMEDETTGNTIFWLPMTFRL